MGCFVDSSVPPVMPSIPTNKLKNHVRRLKYECEIEQNRLLS
jgi:hypothetical protein